MKRRAEKTIAGKVVTLGDQAVGKTSLVLRYVEKEYNRYVSPTIGASYFSCSIKVHSTIVKLQIWDTAGQERFRAMAPMFYRNANAVLLLFDITRQDTFENLKSWVAELNNNVETSILMFIVGSKADMVSMRKGITTLFEDIAHAIAKLSGDDGDSESPIHFYTGPSSGDAETIVIHRGSENDFAHAESVRKTCC